MRYVKLMILFLFMSCVSDQNESDLTNYLEQDLKLNFSKEHSLFIIIPLTACPSCLDATKEFLISQNQHISNNIRIVLIDYQENNLKTYAESLDNHYPIYFDKTGKGFKKKFLSESSPLVIRFEEGKASSFNFNINDMEKMKEEVLNFK